MCTSTYSEHDRFRLLLYRREGTDILVEAAVDGGHLPLVRIPPRSRSAQEITNAIRGRWNLETYCLFSLPTDARCQVVEACGPDRETPAGMQWLSAASLSRHAINDPTEYAAIEQSIALLNHYRNGQLPGFFGKPGWLAIVFAWVESQASGVGLRLTGKFRQLNASPTFSLLRFETDGPALWFKAVGEPNSHEYRLILKLAACFSRFVPQILGVRPEWNAWLALEAEGAPLDTHSPSSAWQTAVENLAALQISSFGRGFEFLEAGAKDLRPCSLVELVDPFFGSMGTLMKRQVRATPPALSREELRSLGQTITSALQRIGDKIPNTLGHLDPNPGNLLVSGTHCVFLDWAEAFVGPAFFTFAYLVEQQKRLRSARNSELEASLTHAYLRHWIRFASASELADAFGAVALLAAFAYAAGSPTWRNPETISPDEARHFRSLVRRMKRETELLCIR